MRRTWRTRLSSAFFGLWLLLGLVRPPMLHTCEVHSATHGAAHHDMASMDGTGQSQQGAPQKQCTCVGDCCRVIPTALPAQRIVTTIAMTVIAPTRARAEHEYVAAWVDFVLPFSTAPPATV